MERLVEEWHKELDGVLGGGMDGGIGGGMNGGMHKELDR